MPFGKKIYFGSKTEIEICLIQLKWKNKFKWNLKKDNLGFHIKLRIENGDEMLFWLETIDYNSLTIIFMQSTSSNFTEAEAAGEILFLSRISATSFSNFPYW